MDDYTYFGQDCHRRMIVEWQAVTFRDHKDCDVELFCDGNCSAHALIDTIDITFIKTYDMYPS